MSFRTVLPIIIFYYTSATHTRRIPEDGRLDFKGLASKYGMVCEEHEIVTEDGYILRMFHIPGDKARPVLLLHGILDSSDGFIIRGNYSLTVALARKNYDIWVGNTRGVHYSRRHQRLDPDVDKDYWNFSFHEMGVWDVAAKIDYIINMTGQTQISAIGHSQATTAFFTLGSIRPAYNDKIKIFIALAPVAFLHHVDSSPLKEVLPLSPFIFNFLTWLNKEQIMDSNSLEKQIFKFVCSQEIAYEWCIKTFVMSTSGYDLEEIEPEFWYVAIGHYPQATSLKTLSHYQQIWKKRKFCYMDYNENINLAFYNSSSPPDYDLKKVTMRVALVAALNDRISRLKDIIRLKRVLPNVVEFIILDRKIANHIDFTWGKHMHSYLFPHIMKLLEKYK